MVVDMMEVEHWVRECMPEMTARIVVDMVQLSSVDGDLSGSPSPKPVLAAFLEISDPSAAHYHAKAAAPGDTTTAATIRIFPISAHVEATLASHLPAHMVPSIFFTMPTLPLTPTGQTDWGRLRGMAAQFSHQQVDQAMAQTAGRPRRRPSCDAERSMQALWADILHLNPDSISIDDSFLGLGGDSIAAIRLVTEAPGAGFHPTLADIFNGGTLSSLVSGSA